MSDTIISLELGKRREGYTIRIICITTFIFINLIIDYNIRFIITVMSVMSQCKYSALIMNKVWTQYDQI